MESNGTKIYIDKDNKVLFVSLGNKASEQGIVKIKDSLSKTVPYKSIIVFEELESVQYVNDECMVVIDGCSDKGTLDFK